MDTPSNEPLTPNPKPLSTSSKRTKLIFVIGLLLIVGSIFFIRNLYTRFSSIQAPDKQTENTEVIKPEFPMNITTTRLATISGSLSKNMPIFISNTGTKAVYIIEENGKSIVIVNGVKGNPFDQIDELKISPDGQKVAYIAHNGNVPYVVVNDKVESGYDQIFGLEFSPDGHILKYTVKKGKTMFIVMNGIHGNIYDNISDFVFSPDSRRYAYIAFDEKLSPFLVVDGRKTLFKDPGDSPIISNMLFSPDSTRFGYILSTYKNKVPEASVVIDGKSSQKYDSIRRFSFSPDSRHIAFIATKGERHIDGYVMAREFMVYDQDELDSSNIQSIKSILPGNYSQALVFPSEPFYPPEFAFDPVTQEVTYATFEKNGKYTTIVTQGSDQSSYDFYGLATPIFYSPDGKRIAFGILENLTGGDRIIEVGRDDNEILQRISRPIFSPDSRHLAYAAKDKNTAFLIVDQFRGESYDEILSLPTFSEDSKYIGYGVRKGDEIWWIAEKLIDKGTEQSLNLKIEIDPKELNGLSAYPDARFISKVKTDPCPSDVSGYAICGGTVYKWSSKDDYDKVNSFYKAIKDHSDISCGGGVGFYSSSRDASGWINCQTKDVYLGSVDMKASSDKTNINIYIPDKK